MGWYVIYRHHRSGNPLASGVAWRGVGVERAGRREDMCSHEPRTRCCVRIASIINVTVLAWNWSSEEGAGWRYASGGTGSGCEGCGLG